MSIRCLAVLCAMSLTIPILWITNDAMALNITLRKASPNTVGCDLAAGNTAGIESLEVSCKIGPPSEGQSTPGLVLCLNPGSKKHAAPGIQLREGSLGPGQTFENSSPVNSTNCDEETGVCEKNVVAAATAPQLASLNVACPNRLWTASDFAPCSTTITVKAEGVCGESVVQALATYTCVLNNCQAVLGFNKNTRGLEGPDYTCTQVSVTSAPSCDPYED
jgi:hypothetical protein